MAGRVRSAVDRGEVGHPPVGLKLAVFYEWLTDDEAAELVQFVRDTAKLLPYRSSGSGAQRHGHQKYNDGNVTVRYRKPVEQILRDPSVRSTMDAAIEDFKRRREIKGKIQTMILYEDTAVWIRPRSNP